LLLLLLLRGRLRHVLLLLTLHQVFLLLQFRGLDHLGSVRLCSHLLPLLVYLLQQLEQQVPLGWCL
jgi:hypothetical protein